MLKNGKKLRKFEDNRECFFKMILENKCELTLIHTSTAVCRPQRKQVYPFFRIF